MSELMPIKLDMPDAEVIFYKDFFDLQTSEQFFQTLAKQVDWKQERIRIAGSDIAIPRLTAWYGDEGKSYSYSGITLKPLPWIEPLIEIKARVEAETQTHFNSVLLNYYRSEQDSVAWHSDDEPELGVNPIIAAVSLGSTRTIQFKHKTNDELKTEIELVPGSLLIMRGTTQHFWKHRIPKVTKRLGERISLTFRVIQ